MSSDPNTSEQRLPHLSLSEGFSCSSNAPSRNSSPASVAGGVAVWTSVNAAFGNCFQTARSSAVTVSQPNVNIYRPGSVTRPAFCQVILLTTDHFFLLKPATDGRRRGSDSRLGAGPERSSIRSHFEGVELQ